MTATSVRPTADAPARRSPARRALDEVIAAVGLLTRVPVSASLDGVARTGAGAFGLVGALLGVVAATPVLAVGGQAPLLGAALAIVALAVASGALHLDGLADTADALAAPSAEAAERARRDPRVGAAGAVAIGGALLVDVAALATLAGAAGPAAAAGPAVAAATLMAAGAFSRAAPCVVGVALRPGSRGGDRSSRTEGFGRWFADRVSPTSMTAAVLTAVGASVPLLATGGLGPAAAAVAGAAVGVLLSLAVVRLRRGLDGDALGAGVELTFSAVLVSVAVVASFGLPR